MSPQFETYERVITAVNILSNVTHRSAVGTERARPTCDKIYRSQHDMFRSLMPPVVQVPGITTSALWAID